MNEGTSMGTIDGVNLGHLARSDAAELKRLMAIDIAPLRDGKRRKLQTDVVSHESVIACGKRKGMSVGVMEAFDASFDGRHYFELGCWLHHYSDKVGGQKGIAHRIDCLRRILISDYHSASPRYRFHTVFDFGERQFDAIMEMNDSEDVMRAIVGLRTRAAVADKFKMMGWTEEYLQQRGYIGADGVVTMSSEQGQSALFSF